jgi:hypothetical protein
MLSINKSTNITALITLGSAIATIFGIELHSSEIQAIATVVGLIAAAASQWFIGKK